MNKVYRAACLMVLAFTAYAQYIGVGGGDTITTIVDAKMLLGGKTLYKDVFTVQPPLIFGIYMIPLYVGRLLHISDNAVIAISGWLIAILSAWLTGCLLAAHSAFEKRPEMRRSHFWLVCLVFIASTSPLFFFEREYIFLCLVFPYLMRWMPSLSDKPAPLGLRLAIGVMAGIGFCIKPHCAIVFIIVQLLVALRRNSPGFWRSTENIVIYTVALLYAAFIVVCTPDYLRIVLPMAFETYAAQGDRRNGVFFACITLGIVIIAFAGFRRRFASPLRQDIYYLLVLCFATMLYAFANNGWAYTFYPVMAMGLVLTGWLRLEYAWLAAEADMPDDIRQTARTGARICAVSLGLFIGVTSLGSFAAVVTSCTQHLKCSKTGRDMFAAMDGKPSFGTMSGIMNDWAQLADMTGARWDTRFNHLWMVPQLFAKGPEFRRTHLWIWKYTADALAEDLDRNKPAVIFVDEIGIMNLVSFFSEFPTFRAAWSHYSFSEGIAYCQTPDNSVCRFGVYQRVP